MENIQKAKVLDTENNSIIGTIYSNDIKEVFESSVHSLDDGFIDYTEYGKLEDGRVYGWSFGNLEDEDYYAFGWNVVIVGSDIDKLKKWWI